MLKGNQRNKMKLEDILESIRTSRDREVDMKKVVSIKLYRPRKEKGALLIHYHSQTDFLGYTRLQSTKKGIRITKTGTFKEWIV